MIGKLDLAARTVICAEFEAYPEPKILDPDDLKRLYERYGSQKAVARAIGTSRVFVTENIGKLPKK